MQAPWGPLETRLRDCIKQVRIPAEEVVGDGKDFIHAFVMVSRGVPRSAKCSSRTRSALLQLPALKSGSRRNNSAATQPSDHMSMSGPKRRLPNSMSGGRYMIVPDGDSFWYQFRCSGCHTKYVGHSRSIQERSASTTSSLLCCQCHSFSRCFARLVPICVCQGLVLPTMSLERHVLSMWTRMNIRT